MIMISLNTIRHSLPCASGWKAVLAGQGKSFADDELFPVSAILDSNGLADTLWTLRCLYEHDNLWRKYAVWCIQQVQHLITDTYSHCAFDAVKRYSEGKATKAELLLAADDLYRFVCRESPNAVDVAIYHVTSKRAGTAVYKAANTVTRLMVHASMPCNTEAKLRQILTLGYWTEESP